VDGPPQPPSVRFRSRLPRRAGARGPP
jgi:hypothetical protein